MFASPRAATSVATFVLSLAAMASVPVHAGQGVEGTNLVDSLKSACDALLTDPTPENAKAVSIAWARAPGTAKVTTSETRVNTDPAIADVTQSQVEDSVIDRFGVTRTVFVEGGTGYPMVFIRRHDRPTSVLQYRSNRTQKNLAATYDKPPMRWYLSRNKIQGDPLHGAIVSDPLDRNSAVWPLQFIIGTQGPGGGDFIVADGTISYTAPGAAYLAANPPPDLSVRPTVPFQPGWVWGSDSWVMSDRCTKVRDVRERVFNFPTGTGGGSRSQISIVSELQAKPVPDNYVPRGKYVTKQ